MEFYSVEKLGAKQSLTQEGFLLCQDIPIGRTGIQIYHPTEISDENGRPVIEPVGDVIRVQRPAEEVFAPQAMASGRGKPVVDDHPSDGDGNLIDVTPENWRDLAVGHVLDIRQGEGGEDDVLLADLLITDARAIALIRGGKRQLSIGYSCDYHEVGPGLAEQRNILINHVALVGEGRCGTRCAIGDSAAGVEKMASPAWLRKLLAKAHVADSAAAAEALAREAPPDAFGEGGGHETHIHLHNGGHENATAAQDGEGADPWAAGKPIKPPKAPGAADEGAEGAGGGVKPPVEGGEGGERAADPVVMIAALSERVDDIEDLLSAALGGGEEAPAEDQMQGDAAFGAERKAANDACMGRLRDRIAARRKGRDAGTDEDGDKPVVPPEFAEEAPAGTEDRAMKARDSAFLQESFLQTVALAEIIQPGIQLPVFHMRTAPQRTFDAICDLRKRAVVAAYGTADGKSLIDSFLGSGRTFDARNLQCKRAKELFLQLGAVKRHSNTRDAAGATRVAIPSGDSPVGGVKTPDDLNKIYAEHYARQNA